MAQVEVNGSALCCATCNEMVRAYWRVDATMSPSATKLFNDYRRAHWDHEGFQEALPILGHLLPENMAPPVGNTLFQTLDYPPPSPASHLQ